MTDQKTTYRVKQYGGSKRNISTTDFESLVTHHPDGNRDARMVDGVPAATEDLRPDYTGRDRSYAFIGGELQEIIDTKTDRYGVLREHQVLLVKDLILEDPFPSAGKNPRHVDVPSPVAGYISARRDSAGMVEIMDRRGGEVIARVRHMSSIDLKVGDAVEYGQRLGTQNEIGLKKGTGKHVHLEMDTNYYQQYENYIADLVTGRLPVQKEYRAGVKPQPVVDDGVMRLGESGERVAALQRALVADGYRGIGGKPIMIDGVYRPDIQGAVLAFQQDHKLPQTGDIDPATYQLALRVNLDKPLAPANTNHESNVFLQVDDKLFNDLRDVRRGLDPAYTSKPYQHRSSVEPLDPARTGREPQHHDHPDHMLYERL